MTLQWLHTCRWPSDDCTDVDDTPMTAQILMRLRWTDNFEDILNFWIIPIAKNKCCFATEKSDKLHLNEMNWQFKKNSSYYNTSYDNRLHGNVRVWKIVYTWRAYLPNSVKFSRWFVGLQSRLGRKSEKWKWPEPGLSYKRYTSQQISAELIRLFREIIKNNEKTHDCRSWLCERGNSIISLAPVTVYRHKRL